MNEYQKRAEAFLEELEALCKKHDVTIYGHDGKHATHLAVGDGAKDFDPSEIEIVK